mgnify:CR=1 FL=1
MARLLIVDDEDSVRDVLRQLFEYEGHEVALAASGDEAIRAVGRTKPDVVFLDVKMPGKDGLTWCAELKRDPRYARIPIVLLSARGQERDREQALKSGATEFMTKPYSPYELKRLVRRLLG